MRTTQPGTIFTPLTFWPQNNQVRSLPGLYVQGNSKDKSDMCIIYLLKTEEDTSDRSSKGHTDASSSCSWQYLAHTGIHSVDTLLLATEQPVTAVLMDDCQLITTTGHWRLWSSNVLERTSLGNQYIIVAGCKDVTMPLIFSFYIC